MAKSQDQISAENGARLIAECERTDCAMLRGRLARGSRAKSVELPGI